MAKKILIVEPDMEYAEPLKELLIRHGFMVMTVTKMEQALKVCKKESVDAVLSELMIDDGDGLDLLIELKKTYAFPVLIFSSQITPDKSVECFEMGADDCLKKPLHFGELMARLNTRLAMYEKLEQLMAPADRPLIVTGELTIDKHAKRVTVRGEEKSFTSKEYDMLLYLAEHPNQVFSKEELFHKIWDMKAFGEIATVTVHIKKIRAKIEKDPSEPKYIETVWGAGYRFKA